jgi:SAM-dependent methyltransferase
MRVLTCQWSSPIVQALDTTDMDAIVSTCPMPHSDNSDPVASPAELNGDHALSSDEKHAYLNFHAARNRANATKSKREGIRTHKMPKLPVSDPSLASPSRVAMDRFVVHYAAQLTRYWGGRNIRVLDIGCGSGYASTLLEQGGLHGTYLGIDHQLHPKFCSIKSAQFTRQHITNDIHELQSADLGQVDLLISMTSLEHFRDDAAALKQARKCLAPGGAELHIVPAEDGLRLWEAHGWRQYSPRCVQALCPNATIYRIGGLASGFIHERTITCPNREHIDWRARHPDAYRALRFAGLLLDPLFGNRCASLYAAVVAPSSNLTEQELVTSGHQPS